jgi:alpha-tubulin suppressor-like RCC1 family protein
MRSPEQVSVTRPSHSTMRHIDHATRVLGAVVIVAVPLWIGACADDPPTRPGHSEIDLLTLAAIVSDPLAAVGQPLAPRTAAAASLVNVVYVSLPPETVERGSIVEIRNLTTGFTRTDSLVAGGLDPVAVPASVGDTLELRVLDGAVVTMNASVIVRPRSPPRVVRTVPPPKKRDVALNSRIQVVFSEPMDGSTITTATVQLLKNNAPVAGRVELAADGLRADFVPETLLERLTDYTLVVATGAGDLSGDVLGQSLIVDFTTSDRPTASPVVSVTVTPGNADLVAFEGDPLVGGQYGRGHVRLTATARDASGSPVTGSAYTWTISNEQVARFTGWDATNAGLEPVAPGEATIAVTVDGVQGLATITVLTGMVEPEAATLRVGDTLRLAATVLDSAGTMQDGWHAGWSTSVDPRFITVHSASANSGLAIGVAAGIQRVTVVVWHESAPGNSGSTGIEVMVGSGRPVTSVAVQPDTVRTLPGAQFLLRATLRDEAGDTTSSPVTWSSTRQAINPSAYGILWNEAIVYTGEGASFGVAATAGRSSGTTAVLIERIAITAVSHWDGEVPYGSWGLGGVCALTPAGDVYCAGDNKFPLGYGLIGDGSMGPVAVTGGLTFTAISGSGGHRCGLTATGVAYCWGLGYLGQLGTGAPLQNCDRFTIGQFIACSPAPVPVGGELRFARIRASVNNTCALTLDGVAYCWGYNQWGQVGDGTTIQRSTPVPAATALTFAELATGLRHACALTDDGLAYCWGHNDAGQLGNGSTIDSSTPVAVAGGSIFTRIDADASVTCALSTDGTAYCWGAGTGSPTGTGSSTPVPVAAGFSFTDLSVAGTHSCGLTAAGAVYCWGWHGDSYSDDWTFLGPTLISGGLTFASLSTGGGTSWGTSCGMTTTGIAYCWTFPDAPYKLWAAGQR